MKFLSTFTENNQFKLSYFRIGGKFCAPINESHCKIVKETGDVRQSLTEGLLNYQKMKLINFARKPVVKTDLIKHLLK